MSVQVYKNGIVSAGGTLIGNNLFINSDFHQTYQQTTGWDTSKNGTLLANSWGGYNSGVSNASTVYHAHLIYKNGDPVYEYIRTSSKTWLGVSQGGLQNRGILPSTTYTFSIDQYRVADGNNYITGGLYFRVTGSTTYSFGCGCPQIVSDTTKERWIRGVFTFTTPANIDTSANISFYIYGDTGGTGTVYMKNPKLEIGDTATPLTLNTSEGYVEGQHGFIETNNSIAKFYKNFTQANEFIEY